VINALGLHRHPFLSHIILLLEQDMEKIPTQLEFIPSKSLVYLCVCVCVCVCVREREIECVVSVFFPFLM
jgi:hypothetical protein